MCRIGTTHQLIRYLATFGTRSQIYPEHPLNDILDKLCPHLHRTTEQVSYGDPCWWHTCDACGHVDIT
jgi:hypothetical protein